MTGELGEEGLRQEERGCGLLLVVEVEGREG